MKNLTPSVRQRDLLEEFGVPDIQIALMKPERAPFQCILGSVINKQKPKLRGGTEKLIMSRYKKW